MENKELRLAISKGIDRRAIVDVAQHGLTDHPVPLNNHVYVVGQEGYQNNSAPADYNPDQARRELDALGYKLNGAVREKDGKQLVVRDVVYDAPAAKQIALVAQQNLAQIGVKLQLDIKTWQRLLQPVRDPRRLRHRSIQLGGWRFAAVARSRRSTLPKAAATSAK